MIPQNLHDFEEVLLEAQPAHSAHVVTSTARNLFNLLGALDDAEMVKTVRACNGQNPVNIFVKHQEPRLHD